MKPIVLISTLALLLAVPMPMQGQSIEELESGFTTEVLSGMRKIKRSLNQNKTYSKGVDKEKAEKLVEKMVKIADEAPENIKVTSPLTKLYVSLGKNDEALAVSKKALKGIQELWINRLESESQKPAIFGNMEVRYPDLTV